MSVLEDLDSDTGAPVWQWTPSGSARAYYVRARHISSDALLRVALPLGLSLAAAGANEAQAKASAAPHKLQDPADLMERLASNPQLLSELEGRRDVLVCEAIGAFGVGDGDDIVWDDAIAVVPDAADHSPPNGRFYVGRLPLELRNEVFSWAIASLTGASRRVLRADLRCGSSDGRRDREEVRPASKRDPGKKAGDMGRTVA